MSVCVCVHMHVCVRVRTCVYIIHVPFGDDSSFGKMTKFESLLTRQHWEFGLIDGTRFQSPICGRESQLLYSSLGRE